MGLSRITSELTSSFGTLLSTYSDLSSPPLFYHLGNFHLKLLHSSCRGRSSATWGLLRIQSALGLSSAAIHRPFVGKENGWQSLLPSDDDCPTRRAPPEDRNLYVKLHTTENGFVQVAFVLSYIH